MDGIRMKFDIDDHSSCMFFLALSNIPLFLNGAWRKGTGDFGKLVDLTLEISDLGMRSKWVYGDCVLLYCIHRRARYGALR